MSAMMQRLFATAKPLASDSGRHADTALSIDDFLGQVEDTNLILPPRTSSSGPKQVPPDY